MERQFGFVLTKGVIAIVAILLLGLIALVAALSPGRPQQPATAEQDQAAQQPPAPTTNEAKDIQTKEDVARVATAVSSYVSNNSGTYPNATQLDEVLTKYISTKPFLSPITQNSYVLTLDTAHVQGVMNLQRGTCNADKNGIVPTQNTRTYALLTVLTDKTVYCVDT